MGTQDMEWTEDVIARLRALWAEGHSTAEIGRRIGVSKNAIVGKAHRLDLPARPSPIRRDPVPAEAARPTPTRRVDGPTLPPLASTDSPVPVVETMIEPPPPQIVPPPPAAVLVAPEAKPQIAEAVAMAVEVVPMPAPEPVTPAAAPPRPVPVAMARPQPAQARPYGRVITCCWPIGEPGTRSFRFCDAPSEPGKPYCTEHAKVAYVKVRDRREDAA
jgi:GcrA cell cycle regulator